ncbi:MAG: 4-hydroxy-tetrahydrodipicolinate reductase [Rhodovibrionaceae bacterium]
MSEVRIGVLGCAGRMGRMLLEAVWTAEGAALSGGTVRPGSTAEGRDLGALAGFGEAGIAATKDAAALFAASDAVIDFTTPEATAEHAALARDSGRALIVGTTGLPENVNDALREAAEKAVIVQAPNMSLGVNLLLSLVEQVAATLPEAYDIEVLEMHHRHKVDAPSGTALGLGAAAARGRKVDLETAAVRSRDGQTGPRESGTIGFATLRGGDVTGEHTVIFAGEGERIELTHKSSSRAVFAQGAVRAAIWSAGQKPGLYSMREVLGL